MAAAADTRSYLEAIRAQISTVRTLADCRVVTDEYLEKERIINECIMQVVQHGTTEEISAVRKYYSGFLRSFPYYCWYEVTEHTLDLFLELVKRNRVQNVLQYRKQVENMTNVDIMRYLQFAKTKEMEDTIHQLNQWQVDKIRRDRIEQEEARRAMYDAHTYKPSFMCMAFTRDGPAETIKAVRQDPDTQ